MAELLHKAQVRGMKASATVILGLSGSKHSDAGNLPKDKEKLLSGAPPESMP